MVVGFRVGVLVEVTVVVCLCRGATVEAAVDERVSLVASVVPIAFKLVLFSVGEAVVRVVDLMVVVSLFVDTTGVAVESDIDNKRIGLKIGLPLAPLAKLSLAQACASKHVSGRSFSSASPL